MKVIAYGCEYECASARKTENAVYLYDENGTEFSAFEGVKDTSVYTVEDGDWMGTTAEEARAMRDKLLLETDWTQVLDAPISAESREAFRVYRQALRDITEQESFPEVIDWPVKPEVVKAAPDPVDTALDVLIGEEEG